MKVAVANNVPEAVPQVAHVRLMFYVESAFLEDGSGRISVENDRLIGVTGASEPPEIERFAPGRVPSDLN